MTLTLLTNLKGHDNWTPPPLVKEELRNVASQLGLDVNILQQNMKGGFGSVFIAEDHGLSRHVAIKILYKEWKPERMRREIDALRTFCSNQSIHSNLITIYSCFETEHYFCYTMECADNSAPAGEEYKPDSLCARIDKAVAEKSGPPSTEEIADFFHQLLDAVEYLHSQKLVHLDIKPDNILFVKGKLKLADYSLITRMEDVINKTCGTSGFVPPNQRHDLNGGLDGVDQDLYALGVVLRNYAGNSQTWDGVSSFSKELQAQPFYKKLNRFLLKACNACESERFHSVSELRKGFDACFPQKKTWGAMLAAGVPIVLLFIVLALQMIFVMNKRQKEKDGQEHRQASGIEEAFEQKRSNDLVNELLNKHERFSNDSDIVARSLFYGYPDAIVEKIVEKKANVNAVFVLPENMRRQAGARQETTALFLAVEQNRPRIVELLLKHGADVNWKDENGNTVKDLPCPEEIREILKSEGIKVKDAMSAGKLATVAMPEEYLYAVVDLSGGPEAANYPVRYTNAAPDLNGDICRTTELWLRKIEPGTFTMGSSADEVGHQNGIDMVQHEVTLTHLFYIGVFECTQKQWELVMGSNPSFFQGDCRPVENIPYNMIRATDTQDWAGWPAYGHGIRPTTFMGKLHEKTGLLFDLPTEAQWEYACRAGTTTALNSGKNLMEIVRDAAMDEVGRYQSNQFDGKSGYGKAHARVGSYLPNPWGLYDMHGNVREWTLDWWGASTGSTAAVTDPVGPAMGSECVNRGGSWDNHARNCRSAIRFYNAPMMGGLKGIGFRICCYPECVSYAVVDLSGGATAEKYPVRYTSTPPDLDDDTCRTTELWLRKVNPGSFSMGATFNEVGHNRQFDMEPHKVTLTQMFYIGVFECTQKQWELVMGGNPSKYTGDCRPVECVSYDSIRGMDAGAGWPSHGHAVDPTSFMGKLQAKTGLVFDLPTEAQWEFACRAGTTSFLNSGKKMMSDRHDSALDEVGRYAFNKADRKGGYSEHTKVGSYLPNSLGLYDMHGNVWEWCLNWGKERIDSTAAETDPVGYQRGSYRVRRGGGWSAYARSCRAGSRDGEVPSCDDCDFLGFRVLFLP